LLFCLDSVAFSQTCLITNNFPYKHFPQGVPGQPSSGTVFYSFENIPDGIQKNQIITALNNWNTALQNTCANIRFTLGTNNGLGSTLIIKNGPIPNFGAARSEETQVTGDEILVGTLIFNPNLVINGFNFYDPNVGG
jgi:hypothetical protein